MGEHDPQSSLFFRKPGEDLVRAQDIKLALKEAMQDIQKDQAPAISKSNTRFSSQYLVDFLEDKTGNN